MSVSSNLSHGFFSCFQFSLPAHKVHLFRLLLSRETRKKKQELFVCSPSSQMEGMSSYTILFSIVNFKVLVITWGFEFVILYCVVCIKPPYFSGTVNLLPSKIQISFTVHYCPAVAMLTIYTVSFLVFCSCQCFFRALSKNLLIQCTPLLSYH